MKEIAALETPAMAQQLRLFHTNSDPPAAAPRGLGQQTIIVGDCLVEMRQMTAESVDVVVTSPPYNQGIDYASYNDSHPQRVSGLAR